MQTIPLIPAVAVALIATVMVSGASAQDSQDPPAPPAVPRVTYRGLEVGLDVTTGRQGEAAFYFGASGDNGSLAFRFSALDDNASVPCSAGVQYEYLFFRDRTHVTPVAGALAARIFSCATESDGVRPPPEAHGLAGLSAGVRIPVFAGRRAVGALKIVAYTQRLYGLDPGRDSTSRGVSVGFVIGGR